MILWEGGFYLREREHRHCLIDIKSKRTICCFFPCWTALNTATARSKGCKFPVYSLSLLDTTPKILCMSVSMSVFIYFRFSVSNKNYRLEMCTELFVKMGITTVSSNLQSYIPRACNICRNNKTVDFVRIYNHQYSFDLIAWFDW